MIRAGYRDWGNWEKGTDPPTKGWYARCQYDGDVAGAKKVLAELDKYYPVKRWDRLWPNCSIRKTTELSVHPCIFAFPYAGSPEPAGPVSVL